MHDSSRDLLFASVQQSAELQQSLEQVPHLHIGVSLLTDSDVLYMNFISL